MKNELNAFEKFLTGYKVYLVAIATVVYGVLEQGFKQHHWTSVAGAWTWVLAGGGVAAGRAALAEIRVLLLSGVPTSTVVTPTATPSVSGTQTQVAPSVLPTSSTPVSTPSSQA